MALDPIRPTDDTARATARRLLRLAALASLGTLDEAGCPVVTLTAMATAFDGSPLILVSGLSAHTGNLLREPRVSLLVSQIGRGDPLAHPRMTIQATAAAVNREAPERAGLMQRYLAHNQKAALYADFPDFQLVRLSVLRASLNGGFGKAYELTPTDILADMTGAEDLQRVEADALAHMNSDHPQALALYAERLCGMAAGRWRAIGIDPDGLDLQAGDQRARLPFPRRVTDGEALRMVLRELADQARQAA